MSFIQRKLLSVMFIFISFPSIAQQELSKTTKTFDRKILTATKGNTEEMEFDNICTFYNQITQLFGCFSRFLLARLFTESRRASEPLFTKQYHRL